MGFDRCEMLPGQIVVGDARAIEPIRYELHGFLPGTYRVPPPVVRNAYRPDEMAVAKPGGLVVVAQNAATQIRIVSRRRSCTNWASWQ